MKSLNALLTQQGIMGGPNVTLGMIFLTVALSFLLGIGIAQVYKKTHSGFSYNRSFLFTLVMVTMVISLIMMVIQSNVALSLGLVGSLSVIRFRTVLKDTKDMAYLFWVICAGLAVGSANYLLAIVSSALISLVVFCLERVNYGKNASTDYIMVLQSNADSNGSMSQILSDRKIKWEIRSSTVDKETALKEVRYSLFSKLKPKEVEELLTAAQKSDGVIKVSLLSPETNLFI